MAEKTLSKQGHRERLRTQIEGNGLGVLPEHQIVEYLLFCGIPYKDTKPTAYELINRFGNLYGITHTPYESLMSVNGMTRNAALFLRTIPALVKFYESESGAKEILKDIDGILGYLAKTVSTEMEICYCIVLDTDNRVRSVEKIQSGTHDSLAIPTRDIIKLLMEINARKVIVAHNHPSGNITPSADDEVNTFSLKHMLEIVGIELKDHLVLGRDLAYSIIHNEIYKFGAKKQ
jgi:DNA repair protein RadC